MGTANQITIMVTHIRKSKPNITLKIVSTSQAKTIKKKGREKKTQNSNPKKLSKNDNNYILNHN